MPDAITQTTETKRALRFFLAVCFLVAGGLVIFIVQRASHDPQSFFATGIALWQQAIVLIFALAAALKLVRKLRSWAVWEAVFTITLFLGTWYAALLVLPLAWALAAAASLTFSDLLIKRVWSHDIFYLVGACGVAVSLSLWLPAEVLVIWLVAFSLYDILAGPPGGPIMELAKRLVGHGIIPGLIIVGRLRDLALPLKPGLLGQAALLGTGDLVLPLALVARAAFAGLYPALAVLAGVVVGALAMTRGDLLHPRAALPALAAGASIPFIVLRFMSVI